MRILVLLKEPTDFQAWEPGQPLMIGMMWVDAPWDGRSDILVCESVFALCNGVPPVEPDGAQQAVMAQYYAAGNRSLSTGDVVVTEAGAWGVEPTGWNRLDVDEVKACIIPLPLPTA